jgi:imidazolonepropionase-like amidohydrolase
MSWRYIDSERIVLVNAAVLDPMPPSWSRAEVMVQDGRVVEVGAATTVRAGDATAPDVRGMTVLPGLVDADVQAVR